MDTETPFWATLEGLPSMMHGLAKLREMAIMAEQRVAITEKAMAATPEGMAFTAARVVCTEVKADLAALDAAVRAEALKDFRANGEKAVYAGVSVKMFTKYDYDVTQLRAWAIEQKVFGLLTLDTKRTEKAAAAGVLENAPIVVSKEPRVQIASDLTSYLAEVTP
jgi:hypothetical protein